MALSDTALMGCEPKRGSILEALLDLKKISERLSSHIETMDKSLDELEGKFSPVLSPPAIECGVPEKDSDKIQVQPRHSEVAERIAEASDTLDGFVSAVSKMNLRINDLMTRCQL